MESVGFALAAVAVVDPLIRAVRGLRQICHALGNEPNDLARLEQDASTINLYLDELESAIERKHSEYPERFLSWLKKEKELLSRLATQIETYTKTLEKRLENSKLLRGMAYTFDIADITKFQDQLVRSINTISHMKNICQQGSLESRVAAMEAKKSRDLRAQTASSLAACSESFCNVSGSMGESGSIDSEQYEPYQDVLKKSRPYKKAAMRVLLGRSVRSSSAPEEVPADQKQTPVGSGSESDDPLHTTESLPNDFPSHHATYLSIEHSLAHPHRPQVTTLTTHSTSSQRTDASLDRGWTIPLDGPSFSTLLTTQTSGSSGNADPQATNDRRHGSLEVEIEDVGRRTMGLDQLRNGDVYRQVSVAISALRDDILKSTLHEAGEASVTPKTDGIILHEANAGSGGETSLRLNPKFLEGALEELDAGRLARVVVFATFVLAQPKGKPQLVPAILDGDKTGSNGTTGGWPDQTQLPSIETVLEICRWPTGETRLHSSSRVDGGRPPSWSLIWISSEFRAAWSVPTLMPDGPEWSDQEPIANGGSSEVYKVRLSWSHEYCLADPDGVFALKKLKPGHERTFRRELDAHVRLAPHKHPHIVSLLMAYERGGSFHLLFPWADGTLATLFRTLNADPTLHLSWMAQQVAALSEALHLIHSSRTQSVVGDDPDYRYGRHGDIKPANILWFPSPKNPGVLQLADFGLAGFHEENVEKPARTPGRRIGGTPAYMAPDPVVSRSYDMWSLGCVMLEFMVWSLGGYKALRTFYSARFKDGDGRGYLTLPDGSIRLHPSLRDPALLIWSIWDQQRHGGRGSPPVDRGLERFLDHYCGLMERCLDLDPANRPSASRAAAHLRWAEAELEHARSRPPSSSFQGWPQSIHVGGNPSCTDIGKTSNSPSHQPLPCIEPLDRTETEVDARLVDSDRPRDDARCDTLEETWRRTLKGRECSSLRRRNPITK